MLRPWDQRQPEAKDGLHLPPALKRVFDELLAERNKSSHAALIAHGLTNTEMQLAEAARIGKCNEQLRSLLRDHDRGLTRFSAYVAQQHDAKMTEARLPGELRR